MPNNVSRSLSDCFLDARLYERLISGFWHFQIYFSGPDDVIVYTSGFTRHIVSHAVAYRLQGIETNDHIDRLILPHRFPQ